MAAGLAALERELAAKTADAEARIDAAKVSALKEVNAVAAETASEIVRRLIGIAPSGPEVASAVAAAHKE